MNKQELTYWVTLSMIPKIWTKRKNEIFVNCFLHKPNRISIIELFENSSLWEEIGLTEDEMQLFLEAKKQLANNSFLIEDLLNQGYDVIPLISNEYPQSLKDNLKQGAPTVIYTKGNKELLRTEAIAIVGSRKADMVSLEFTNNIAKKGVLEQKVVVSGFAKGVDRQALDSALNAGGKSIIVLPQGITTFTSGYKQYYKPISQGNVLVISTFYPNSPWSVELAMARNPIIYGMANEIFVAQSDEKGGTWSGVIDGLRKERKIYVRYPNPVEKNANLKLIQKGAQAVDMFGRIRTLNANELLSEEEVEYKKIDDAILELLTRTPMPSKVIGEKLKLDWSDPKIKKHLRGMSKIEEFKEKGKIYFRVKQEGMQDLFANN